MARVRVGERAGIRVPSVWGKECPITHFNFTHGAHDKRDVVRLSSLTDQAGLHPRPQEVDVFLAMDEHGAGVRGGAGNRPMAWTSAKVFPVDTPAGPGEMSLQDGLDPVGIVVVQ